MKKNRIPGLGIPIIMPKKFVLPMRLTFLLIVVLNLSLAANSYSQEDRVSLDVRNTSLETIIKSLRAQTGYYFFYSADKVEGMTSLSIKADDMPLSEVLTVLLSGTHLTFSIVDKVVVIRDKRDMEPAVDTVRNSGKLFLKGRVREEGGGPLPGVTVMLKERNTGNITDGDGNFVLEIPLGVKKATIVFSFIGMQTEEISWTGQRSLDVVLKRELKEIEEVVVTGYFNRSKTSYTGSAISVKKEELTKISPNNLLGALQVFDPSFRLQENLNSGSNPNVMPHIRVRGDSGLGNAFSETTWKNDPNMPTFIVDGYEVSVEKVYDLNMERVESITILKDASATAIYGSRAANGVVVITTKAPEAGKLRLTYNFNGVLQTPDLTDYNLMNAAEKLETEHFSGWYTYKDDPYSQQLSDKDYALRLTNVRRGVDTYWLSQPVQTVLGRKHSLYMEGGDESIRYGVDINYQDNPGAIKKSYRDRYGLGFKLQYNYDNKLLFRNDISVNKVKSQESPYGSFHNYANTNPYWPVKDDDGNLIEKYPQNVVFSYLLLNPLYEARLNHRDEAEYLEVTDNFDYDWFITDNLRLKGRVSYTLRNDHKYRFTDPQSILYTGYDYQEGEGVTNKGDAYNFDERSRHLDANMLITYNQGFGKHYVNAVLGGNIQESRYENTSFRVRGFPSGNMDYVSFGKEFVEKSPGGSEGLSRLCGAFLNVNYTYDNIYLLDFSGRIDGSSKFGKNKRFAPFWSLGAGWNIHKEAFYGIGDIINHMKATFNVGEIGKASFSPYEAQNMYTYYKGKYYAGGLGAILTVLGNEELKWEITRSLDVNLELGILNNRISARFTYYDKLTDGLLADITLPESNGFLYFRDNVGKLENSGYEISLRAFVFRTREANVSVFGSLIHNKNTIKEISNSLKAQNEKIDYEQDHYRPKIGRRYETAKPRAQYKEGESTTAIYAVPSLGINPMNGKEVYLDRFGHVTYNWRAADKVACGDTEPEAAGSFGLNADWKGWGLNMSFMYEYGGQIYNQTLVDRVENADFRYNIDRRVMSGRWRKAGDDTFFKDIRDRSRTNLTSRMVQDNNVLQFKSLSLSYSFSEPMLRKMSVERLKLTFSMEDLFYWASVKRERGLDYPYTHSFNFGLQLQF